MILKIHHSHPEKRLVMEIAKGLQNGDVYILPTDTAYAFVCSLNAPRAIAELYKIKNIPETHPLSLLCSDVSMASNFIHQLSTAVFKFMKSYMPGPYTIILRSNRNMDRRGMGKKKTVGIRIVNHPLHRAIMENMEGPLVATSVITDDEYLTDPKDLDRLYGKKVKAIVDDGIKVDQFSTILDATEDHFRLIRMGTGPVDMLGLEEDS